MPYRFYSPYALPSYAPNYANNSAASACAIDWNWLTAEQKIAAMEEHLAHVAAREGRAYTGTPIEDVVAMIASVDRFCNQASTTGYMPVVYRSPYFVYGHRQFSPAYRPFHHPSGQVAPPLQQPVGNAVGTAVAGTTAAVVKTVLLVTLGVAVVGTGAYFALREPRDARPALR